MMDDTNPFAPAAVPVQPDTSRADEPTPGSAQGHPRAERRAAAAPALSAGGREVQFVPLARDARRRGVLHPPRRAAVCRQGRFVAESWCPECAFYKLRRTPKKRERV